MDPTNQSNEMSLLPIAEHLARRVDELDFSDSAPYVYNPALYACRPLEQYLSKFGSGQKEIVLVGMNPGPFGMAQTGVPFGDVAMVRDWMGIVAPVDKPSKENSKRPVLGFACPRSEISGSRLWGWAKERYGEPAEFFKRFFVWNYCPLCFMEEGGRNITPDKLPKRQTDALFAECNRALAELCRTLRPSHIVGVGKFAEGRIKAALPGCDAAVGSILHPSPASPLANRGWAEQAERGFAKLGISL